MTGQVPMAQKVVKARPRPKHARRRAMGVTAPAHRTAVQPRPHRGSSEQSVGTPRDLLDAVEGRFGQIGFDLAADVDNCCAQHSTHHFSETHNALAPETHWPRSGVLWLNPPFADVAPWAERCAQWLASGEASAASLLLLLVPASVDSNWWMESVAGHARVLSLNPRVKFVGHKQGFPKPLALCVYDPRFPLQPALVEPWRWKV